jgi:hypothetical protein
VVGAVADLDHGFACGDPVCAWHLVIRTTTTAAATCIALFRQVTVVVVSCHVLQA